jgi:hemerythrin-like metal-binding protein
MLDAVDLYHLQRSQIAEIIDRQHSQIRLQQQNLRSAIIEGMGMSLIVACAKLLIDTTIDHFKSEENAMEASNFAGLGAHRLLHAEWINRVEKIWSDLEHRKITDAMELLEFFDVRLTYHLESEDGAFGRELNNIKK